MESCPEVTWELEHKGAMAQQVERWEAGLPGEAMREPGHRDRTMHNGAKLGLCRGPMAVFSWGREK